MFLISFLLFFSSFTSAASEQSANKQKVETMLNAAKLQDSSTNWMMYFAKQFYGTPYVGGTLDRENNERLVVNLNQLDCTTYVETVLALSLCAKNNEKTYDDYLRHLRQIRYIDGEVSYIKRKHYFTTWIDENVKQGIVDNIKTANPPFSAVQTVSVNWMTKHPDSYFMLRNHSEWLSGIRAMENAISGKKYPYIPKENLRPTTANNQTLKKFIQDGDIIAILTSKKGLDTTHIGIASWHKNGLHLINASQIHKKVIDEPMLFYDYMQKHPTQIGIRVVRMH